jgi:ABC-type multidrug transport system fused ATPase/permease subunit
MDGNKTALNRHIYLLKISTFKYEEENVLKDLHFEVKKGQTIALVGQQKRKSTIANLLTRFMMFSKEQLPLTTPSKI